MRAVITMWLPLTCWGLFALECRKRSEGCGNVCVCAARQARRESQCHDDADRECEAWGKPFPCHLKQCDVSAANEHCPVAVAQSNRQFMPIIDHDNKRMTKCTPGTWC